VASDRQWENVADAPAGRLGHGHGLSVHHANGSGRRSDGSALFAKCGELREGLAKFLNFDLYLWSKNWPGGEVKNIVH